MTADHAARAAELVGRAVADGLSISARDSVIAAAQVHAILALADAVGRTHNPTRNPAPNPTHNRPRWDDDLRSFPRVLPDPAEPCPTCSGPTRETVGMVCQTCGTDYAAPDHPEIVTERGQERPNGAGDVQAEVEPDTSAAERGPR